MGTVGVDPNLAFRSRAPLLSARSAGLLGFRSYLAVLFVAEDCPDWLLAVRLPPSVPVTPCSY
jgi:hypothetical protein